MVVVKKRETQTKLPHEEIIYVNCTAIQWNIIQLLKRYMYFDTLQHEKVSMIYC